MLLFLLVLATPTIGAPPKVCDASWFDPAEDPACPEFCPLAPVPDGPPWSPPPFASCRLCPEFGSCVLPSAPDAAPFPPAGVVNPPGGSPPPGMPPPGTND